MPAGPPRSWPMRRLASGSAPGAPGMGRDRRRPPGGAYRLLEFQPRSAPMEERFDAPDDDQALRRVLAILPEGPFELWRGNRLVSRRLRP